ncbi:MAG: class I SAM-dependent methyltransferase [Gammaproteobacteria bacterium]
MEYFQKIETITARCPICEEVPSIIEATGIDFEYLTTYDYEWALRRCSNCEIIMLSPRPADLELSRIYPSNYYAYSFTTKKSIGFRIKNLLDHFSARFYLRGLGKDVNILDVGCGDGRLLNIYSQMGIANNRLYGTELNKNAAQLAKEKGYHINLGTFENSIYPDQFFDLIVLQQVIEHMPDPQNVLEKINRILKPSGRLILETPNIKSWDRWLFRHRWWGGYHIPRHFYLFNPNSLKLLLERNGFKVTKIQSLISPSFWNHSIHHWLTETKKDFFINKFFDSHSPNLLVLLFFATTDMVGRVFGITSNMRIIARRKQK